MAAVKTYRPYVPEQPYLLPPSPSEWLPKGHLAYFVDLVADLDLGGEIDLNVFARTFPGLHHTLQTSRPADAAPRTDADSAESPGFRASPHVGEALRAQAFIGRQRQGLAVGRGASAQADAGEPA